MSQFVPEDRQGSIDFVSDRDITFESDRDQDGAGDIVFRTGGVERARLNHDGTGTGPFGGSITYVRSPTGVQATDDASILAAIAALPAAGGQLIFGPGTYNTPGGYTISVPCLIRGQGAASSDDAGSVTQIECNNATAVLFTVTAAYAKFVDISLVNTSVDAPTAGSGIHANHPSDKQARVDFESVFVQGFYDNIDVQVGWNWSMHACSIVGPVRYGLRIRNTVNVDWGDWAITASTFLSKTHNATALIQIESAGGGKISSSKINRSDASLAQYGIALEKAGTTQELYITNCGLANVSIPLYINPGWPFVFVNGCFFQSVGDNPAISGSDVDRVVVANNVYSGSHAYAIEFFNAQNVTIGPSENSGFTSLYLGTGYQISVRNFNISPPIDLFVGPLDPRGSTFSLITLGAANRARWTAFQVRASHVVTEARVWVGAQSGNIDIGIYDAAGNLLGSSGSVACPAAGAGHTVPLASSVSLVPGVIYRAAIAADNNTVTFETVVGSTLEPGSVFAFLGGFSETAFPLPSTFTTAGASASDVLLLFE